MQTLTLNLETLRVQSFAVTTEAQGAAVAPLNAEPTRRPLLCDPATAFC
jgi:hypothetical protein